MGPLTEDKSVGCGAMLGRESERRAFLRTSIDGGRVAWAFVAALVEKSRRRVERRQKGGHRTGPRGRAGGGGGVKRRRQVLSVGDSHVRGIK